MQYRLLLRNLRQVVQVTDRNDVAFLTGADMNKLVILNDDCSLCVLVDNEGNIAFVGKEKEAPLTEATVAEIVDCKGGSVLPGFVDGHTHPVFAGDRVHEFAMKLAGATYMQVQEAGGGIHFTTTKTREATEDDLLKDFERIATEMLHNGTTTMEAKSGYGLDTPTEIKMLRVLSRVQQSLPIEISATFCGAHAVPRGSTIEHQTNLICNETLAEIDKLRAAGKLQNLENIDVFCEKGVFDVESTKRILEAGAAHHLHANFHAEELNYIGGAEMGAALKARAMSHLEEVSDTAIESMAAAGTAAVLLPSTAFILRLTPPPARKMIEKGKLPRVIVALGSDFNPNAYCQAMPMIMHLACVTMRLSMPEALVAATLNSAHSIGRGRTHGAIAVGRRADMVVINAHNWEHIIYRMAAHTTLISRVIKSGNVVFENK